MPSSWNEGYVTEIPYTPGYYPELNPARAKFCLQLAGQTPPKVEAACELGFGQGVTVALHAAAQPDVAWYGTDFNPSHAAFARELAHDPERAVRLFEDSFQDFCARPDLPDFDFIGLHGIWSWISVLNRDVIVDFIRRKLRPGGVLYVSYNAYPGWSDIAPVRQLLKAHVELGQSGNAPVFERIGGAIAAMKKLASAEPAYLRAAPRFSDRLTALETLSRSYVAHEYLTEDWRPMYFHECVGLLEPAKVHFGVSANPLDSVAAINLTEAQETLLRETVNPILRETLRDVCVNQQFRRDYWIKGGRPLLGTAKVAALRAQRVVLSVPRDSVPKKVRGARGEGNLDAHVYDPIVAALEEQGAMSIGALAERVEPQGVSLGQVVSAMQVLSGLGVVTPAQTEEEASRAKASCDDINRRIVRSTQLGAENSYLASPITGGGVPVARIPQLFLGAIWAGHTKPSEWSVQTWAHLQAHGHRVMKEGQALESAEANLAELEAQASRFTSGSLASLQRLGIV